jgi:predicted RNase H-like HicB family nuclease
MKYLVVIEESETGFGAYVPDLPGCIAAAASRHEVTQLIHEAIEFHLDGLAEEGLPIPPSHSSPEVVEVGAR